MIPASVYVDDYNTDRTGWARFAAGRKQRYRLARSLKPTITLEVINGKVIGLSQLAHGHVIDVTSVVFLMLNPSVADAFKPDRTVAKCAQFAHLWGADVLEVVNLFALISPYPSDLKTAAAAELGMDAQNDEAILEACTGAHRVVAAWGNHGHLYGRGNIVRSHLHRAGIVLHHLGMTQDEFPMHPLARGKHFIPLDRRPVVWS